jgi:hypothetical protein
VLDAVDIFVMDAKLVLAERARERGIPLISNATLGFGAVLMVFDRPRRRSVSCRTSPPASDFQMRSTASCG